MSAPALGHALQRTKVEPDIFILVLYSWLYIAVCIKSTYIILIILPPETREFWPTTLVIFVLIILAKIIG